MAVVEYYLGAMPVVEPAGPISGGRWRAFWSTADPKMVEAGAGGEFALARIRLAAILLLSVIPINATLRSRAPHNLVGLGMELDAIAAVAVGGTLFSGGRASVPGTLLGALIIQLLRYTLLSNGVPDSAALIVKAAIIVLAVWLQRQGRA